MINETDIRIIFADTDAMGIVYNGTYISFFERGRTEYLRELGYPYKRIEEEGMKLPVGAVTCQYKHPAYADDLLTIKTWIKELKGATVTMAYEIVNKETGTTCVTGTSTHPITNRDLKPIRFKKECPELYQLIKDSME